MLRQIFVQLGSLPRRFLIGAVRLYQKTLSPDYGVFKKMYPHGYCPHSPTCSQYAIEQLQARGAIIGSAKAFWRILHCNPFTKPSDERLRQAAARALDKMKD